MSGYNAIVLAGGASRRMGEPKALLQVGERTLLEHHLALFSGAATVVVVTGPHHALIAAQVAALDAAKVLLAHNPCVDDGPFSSLRLGLRALEPLRPAGSEVSALAERGGRSAPGAPGRARRPVLVLPVDMAPLTGLDVAGLVAAAVAPGVFAALASHEGRDGHPVVLSPAAVAEVQQGPADRTLRDVLAAAGAAVVRVPTRVAAVLDDLDTPADLARHRQNPIC